MKKIFLHGSGHRSSSWQETISHMADREDILCPELSSLLDGQAATYKNLYASFTRYCGRTDRQIHLCGISLGGILALNYAIDHPQKVRSLVLIGTPHQIPKVTFGIQTIFFRFLPKSMFEAMAFDKRNTFFLGNSMKHLDLSGRVESISCPTLILCGKRDRANMQSAYYLSENIKNSELKFIENTGHVVNEESPEVLANILRGFYSLHV